MNKQTNKNYPCLTVGFDISDWASLSSQTTTSVTTTNILPQNCKSENPNVPSLFEKLKQIKYLKTCNSTNETSMLWGNSVQKIQSWALHFIKACIHCHIHTGTHKHKSLHQGHLNIPVTRSDNKNKPLHSICKFKVPNSVMYRSFYIHNTSTTINKLCYEQYTKPFLTRDSTP